MYIPKRTQIIVQAGQNSLILNQKLEGVALLESPFLSFSFFV
jgi:hypothetical protein